MRFAERMLLVTLNDDRALAVTGWLSRSWTFGRRQLFHESGPSESYPHSLRCSPRMDRGYLRKRILGS